MWRQQDGVDRLERWARRRRRRGSTRSATDADDAELNTEIRRSLERREATWYDDTDKPSLTTVTRRHRIMTEVEWAIEHSSNPSLPPLYKDHNLRAWKNFLKHSEKYGVRREIEEDDNRATRSIRCRCAQEDVAGALDNVQVVGRR